MSLFVSFMFRGQRRFVERQHGSGKEVKAARTPVPWVGPPCKRLVHAVLIQAPLAAGPALTRVARTLLYIGVSRSFDNVSFTDCCRILPSPWQGPSRCASPEGRHLVWSAFTIDLTGFLLRSAASGSF